MFSSIRSVTGISRYLPSAFEKKLRLICSKDVAKHCTGSQGCLKTWYHKRTFCSAITPETESNDVSTMYANIITCPEVEKQIKMILLECELVKQSDLRAPSIITEADMKELLELRSLHSRRNYFHYLRTKELSVLGEKKRKETKQIEYQKKLHQREKDLELTGHLRYGLYGNSMFMYIRKAALNSFYLSKLIRAAKFEQPLVFDMDFDEEMRAREIKNTAVQLRDCYGYNRHSMDPFDICFCNLKPESKSMQELRKNIPNVNNASTSMVTVEERSYLDLFPKEKLVYLSPNAKEILKDYESDKIYIVGGIVDKKNEKPLTLAKAKREGIRAARLPLDEYLLWGCGHKNLTINQVMAILLVWKNTNDWNKALQLVPTRKLKKPEDFFEEEERKRQKLRKGNMLSGNKTRRSTMKIRSLFHEN